MSSISRMHDVVALVYSNKYGSPLLSEVAQFCESYYQIQQKKSLADYLVLNKRKKIPRPFGVFLQRRMQRTFSHLLEHQAFDIIHCGHPALMSLFSPRCVVPIVLQQDSLDIQAILSQIDAANFLCEKRTEHRKAEIESYLRSAWRRADAVVVPTPASRDELLRYEPNACVKVVPHGVDAKYYLQGRFLKSSKTVVLTGAMDRPANSRAVHFFLQQIWPKLRERDDEIRLFIVGRRPGPEIVCFNRLRNVYVTGEVIDIKPFIGSATVAVFPQQEGGHAGVKILEAMSMSIPVVCSPQACRGLGLRHNEHALVSVTIKNFVDNILKCMDNKNFSAAIGRAARALVEENNSWEAVSQKLLEVYAELVAQQVRDEVETPSLPVTRVDFPEPQSVSPDKDEILATSEFENDEIRH